MAKPYHQVSSFNREDYDKEYAAELIEKIVVNGDKSIDIVFKYQSPYPVEKQAV